MGAVEAFTASLKLDPMNSDGFEPLMKLDSSTALMMIREALAWQTPPGNPRMRTRLAEALLAAGQEEEANKVVDELRASGHRTNSLTRLFSQISPEAAEAELRASAASAVGKKKTGPLQRLATVLEEAGRKDEARARRMGTLGEFERGPGRGAQSAQALARHRLDESGGLHATIW